MQYEHFIVTMKERLKWKASPLYMS